MAALTPAWFEHEGRQLGRWSMAAVAAICVHAVLIGGYMMWAPSDHVDLGDETPIIAIDLTAPDIDREAQPKSAELPAPPQQSTPDAALPEAKPAGKVAPPTPETRTTHHAEAAAPPIDPTWRTQLIEQLQHFKNYPRAARDRREQGVVALTFSVDRNGHVLSRHIVSSSGHSELDAEALAVIDRAQPLPAFPASMTQAQLDMTWSVRFSLR